ncbi:response regulator [Gramella sp. GC03-9]|uniref:Response regulator n=1 Tax=Christiangramia oceanisediminis TaxID=2920386 RepID=A0A9X2KZ40_9FLAO|nr:response regulator [Gramella oceanisediminis]MCP9200879.1 response regulator [Gramella oceanisediminis]
MKLLLVDDDKVINIIHQKIIKQLYPRQAIHAFSEGLKALKYLETLKVHERIVIFLDLNMPIISGWEFLKRLQDSFYHLRIEVYVVSSSVASGDRRQALKFPIVKSFISKPLTPLLLKQLAILEKETKLSHIPCPKESR